MDLKKLFSQGGWKKIKKNHLLLAGLVGILFLVIAIPTGEKEEKTEEIELLETQKTESEYKEELEEQLENLLKRVEGVGKSEVMITLKDYGEAIVEKDRVRTQEETSEETIYMENETTENMPFVVREITPQVEGVLVVAEGGGNSVVVKNISDAILALFPVEVHKIKVVKMNE